jgi:hypothetical protein
MYDQGVFNMYSYAFVVSIRSVVTNEQKGIINIKLLRGDKARRVEHVLENEKETRRVREKSNDIKYITRCVTRSKGILDVFRASDCNVYVENH